MSEKIVTPINENLQFPLMNDKSMYLFPTKQIEMKHIIYYTIKEQKRRYIRIRCTSLKNTKTSSVNRLQTSSMDAQKMKFGQMD